MLWLLELQNVGQFMEYLIRVYAPGPASDWDLIIVNAGLHWLFVACRLVTDSQAQKSEYLAHALTSRDNLETVLARLSFHTPLTRDCALAMNVAVGMLHRPSYIPTNTADASLQSQCIASRCAGRLLPGVLPSPPPRRASLWVFIAPFP
jgi:hypothetical protein